MGVELDNLREDVLRLDDQLTKETGLRKSLQEEKKTLMAQVQNLVVQLDTSRLAVDSTQRELTDVTNNKVRLESILRDTKSAMQKMTLEQQVEQKSHAQRVAMLEKVISDERAERRNLVSETMEVSASREETLDTLRKANQEISEIKRHRFEKEEEIERLKVLLQAQEQRNAEQLVTVDKYHAVVASHESEMRQIQMLLECEREEAARKMAELQDTYTAAKKSMEQRLEQYSHCCEDLRSHICLREDEKTKEAEKMKRAHLEEQVKGLKARMDVVQESADQNEERAKRAEVEVQKRDARILSLQQSVTVAEEKRDMWKARLDAVLPDVEHASLAREDAQMQYERIRVSTEVFQEVKASLERQLAQAKMEIQRLVASLTRQTAEVGTQVVLNLSDTAQQTDLSYQYLEQADHMQNDRWRRDRLDSLKRASSFVEDVEEKRDFTVIMRRTAPPVAQLGPEAAQQERLELKHVLLLNAEKRGGESGTNRRARKSLHLKIVGGFLAQLEQLEQEVGALHPVDASNKQVALEYIDWLKGGNFPTHHQPLPEFQTSPVGPPLFPVVPSAPSSSHHGLFDRENPQICVNGDDPCTAWNSSAPDMSLNSHINGFVAG
ncbi:unnamed protein product [Symbiodinium sp. CCMP2592]|nr:unnamed protein product [Symbiodinium sp. CCMP2592]